jgi:hypothetical protein
MKKLWRKFSFGQHLIFIILFKMLVLYGFWYAYIKPNKVKVDDVDMLEIYSPTIKSNNPVLNPLLKNSGETP